MTMIGQRHTCRVSLIRYQLCGTSKTDSRKHGSLRPCRMSLLARKGGGHTHYVPIVRNSSLELTITIVATVRNAWWLWRARCWSECRSVWGSGPPTMSYNVKQHNDIVIQHNVIQHTSSAIPGYISHTRPPARTSTHPSHNRMLAIVAQCKDSSCSADVTRAGYGRDVC